MKTWFKLFWLLIAVLPLGAHSVSATLSLPTDTAASELRLALSSAEFVPSSERELGRRLDSSESSSADTEQDDVTISNSPVINKHGDAASANIPLAAELPARFAYHVIRGPPQYF